MPLPGWRKAAMNSGVIFIPDEAHATDVAKKSAIANLRKSQVSFLDFISVDLSSAIDAAR
jgi:hypothetical protein